MKLSGKVALVTGSGNLRGIGRGVAICLAEEGADVVIHSLKIDEETAKKVVAEVQAKGRKACLVMGDISNKQDVENMFNYVVKVFGRLDILVNNAGVCVWEDFLDISKKGFDKIVNVNLKGTIECSRLAAKIMVENRIKGRIINIASCHARRPCPNMAVYGATKAGIDHFSRSLAFELAVYGIRVNQIWPGLVDTDINGEKPEMASEESKKKLLETIPLGVIATPYDVGKAAVYLASDESKTVSGEMIKIDGGAFIKCLQ